MAFADDLLALAQDIADLPSVERRQANIRRAISTAYYALFHLLISEATLNWARPKLRPILGRLFDHGPMNNASINKEAELNGYFKGNPPDSPQRAVAEQLLSVATTFVQAQQRRIDADYSFVKDVDETEMLTQLEAVKQAFKSWSVIRDEPPAQVYLLSMLGNKDRREKKPDPSKIEIAQEQTAATASADAPVDLRFPASNLARDGPGTSVLSAWKKGNEKRRLSAPFSGTIFSR